jgi:hypothetical protein
MSKTSELDGHEISVEANLTPTGGSAKVKSRFLSALDRLGANVVDAVGMPIEAMNATRRKKLEAEIALIDASKRIYIKSLTLDEALQTQAVERHLEGLLRKHENIDGVTRVAFDQLNAQAASTDLEVSSEESEEGAIDELWMNDFEAFAEKASTDSMRELLGRILSGQVRRPNSFSRRTLRVAYELDQSIASLFMKLAKFRTGRFCPKIEGLMEFSDYLDLDTMGLISFNGGQAKATMTSANTGFISLHDGDKHLLRVEFAGSNQSASAPVIPLTQEGYQLANLIQGDELDAFRKLGEMFTGDMKSISIHSWVDASKKQYKTVPDLLIK